MRKSCPEFVLHSCLQGGCGHSARGFQHNENATCAPRAARHIVLSRRKLDSYVSISEACDDYWKKNVDIQGQNAESYGCLASQIEKNF